jgi:hypothetical protein
VVTREGTESRTSGKGKNKKKGKNKIKLIPTDSREPLGNWALEIEIAEVPTEYARTRFVESGAPVCGEFSISRQR